MGIHKNTIELNGNLYDAKSGRMLGVPSLAPTVTAKTIGMSIDGFTSRRQQRPIHTKKKAAENIHSKTLRSKTLMRRGVSKPYVAPARNTPNAVPSETAGRKEHQDLRLKRAQKITTSRYISKFGARGLLDIYMTPVPADISVRPEPTNQNSTIYTAPENTKNSSLSALDIHLQNSLKHASAHKNKPLKKQKRTNKTSKRMNIALMSLAIILIGGFIAYQNSEILAVRIAAQRAGISMTVPGYTPAGFRLNNHTSKAGEITMGYKSNTDGRSYNLTQSISSWDSGALIAHFLDAKTYQVTQTNKGLQVYTYDGSNATWLDHGVWFNLYGDAQLSSNQLSELINSI